MIPVLFYRTKYRKSPKRLRFSPMSEKESNNKRGLASANDDTRARVARAGGEAPHEKRGLQAASIEKRREVARKGGLARGEQRRMERLHKENNASYENLLDPITA